MLVDIILTIVYNVAVGFVRLFPTADFTSGLGEAIVNLNGYLAGVSPFVPILAIISVFSALLVLEGSLLAISVINWFIRKIPSIN